MCSKCEEAKKNGSGWGKINDLFGVDEKRADFIIDTFHAQWKATDNWPDALNNTKKVAEVKGEAENSMLGFVFGRMYSKISENPIAEMLSSIVGK